MFFHFSEAWSPCPHPHPSFPVTLPKKFGVIPDPATPSLSFVNRHLILLILFPKIISNLSTSLPSPYSRMGHHVCHLIFCNSRPVGLLLLCPISTNTFPTMLPVGYFNNANRNLSAPCLDHLTGFSLLSGRSPHSLP